MTYQTVLTNFGNSIYQGSSLEDAKAAALRAGHESTIFGDGVPMLFWSPISGWRGLVAGV